MITDISPFLVYELGSLKGQEVSFCKYKFYEGAFNEGYALVGESNAFFIRIRTHEVEGKNPIYFLEIKAFHESEIGDAFSFYPLSKGVLSNLHFLKNTQRGMIIRSHVIQDITTECGLLAEFEDESRFMIYPKEQAFTDTCCTSETNQILDEMNMHKLQISRSAKQDINLLLSVQ